MDHQDEIRMHGITFTREEWELLTEVMGSAIERSETRIPMKDALSDIAQALAVHEVHPQNIALVTAIAEEEHGLLLDYQGPGGFHDDEGMVKPSWEAGMTTMMGEWDALEGRTDVRALARKNVQMRTALTKGAYVPMPADDDERVSAYLLNAQNRINGREVSAALSAAKKTQGDVVAKGQEGPLAKALLAHVNREGIANIHEPSTRAAMVSLGDKIARHLTHEHQRLGSEEMEFHDEHSGRMVLDTLTQRRIVMEGQFDSYGMTPPVEIAQTTKDQARVVAFMNQQLRGASGLVTAPEVESHTIAAWRTALATEREPNEAAAVRLDIRGRSER